MRKVVLVFAFVVSLFTAVNSFGIVPECEDNCPFVK